MDRNCHRQQNRRMDRVHNGLGAGPYPTGHTIRFTYPAMHRQMPLKNTLADH
jgi:hypothetical protein